MSAAPTDLDELLSPAWLERTLGGRFPGMHVESTTVVESIRTLATKVRFHVEYATSGGAPADLCVKGYFGPNDASLYATGKHETTFYQRVADDLAVQLPTCLHAGIDEDTGHGIVLMNDLVAEGATFLTALVPYTDEQVRSSLDQLASLHARFWNSPQLAQQQWLRPRLGTLMSYVSIERLRELLSDGRGDGLPSGILDADRAQAAVTALASRDCAGHQCLVHADAHAGNLYQAGDGSIGIVDWQLVHYGCWAQDVAYHVATVLTVEDRERHERQLVEYYLDRLRALGVSAPAWGDAWLEYRVALAYGYYLWAITQRVDRPITVELFHRLGSAVARHDSFDLVGV